MGLYVIGNFDLLSAESSLWQTITAGVRQEGRLGEALHLYCQNHPQDEGLVIRTPEDFHRAPEGGCMKPCTARLDCGHACTRMCHPYDKVPPSVQSSSGYLVVTPMTRYRLRPSLLLGILWKPRFQGNIPQLKKKMGCA